MTTVTSPPGGGGRDERRPPHDDDLADRIPRGGPGRLRSWTGAVARGATPLTSPPTAGAGSSRHHAARADLQHAERGRGLAVELGGGTLPGSFMLGGFVALRPETELATQAERALHLDDEDYVGRYAAFRDW